MKKKINLRKKILAIALTVITMFSAVAGFFPKGVAHAANATSGTYYGIDWDMDAEGNLTLNGGTCTDTKGTKWNRRDVKTVKCNGEIICNDKFCIGLFDSNTILVSADLSGFNTSNVTDMSYMFSSCFSLASLDLSSFDGSKLSNADYMFRECSCLDVIKTFKVLPQGIKIQITNTMYDMSDGTVHGNMDVANTTLTRTEPIHGVYYGINWILDTEGNLTLNGGTCTDTQGTKWNRDDVKTVKCNGEIVCSNLFCSSLFAFTTNLVSADLSNLNTSKVTSMRNMFDDCENLTSLDLSNFNTSNVTDMLGMFDECYALTSLDVSSFNTSNVTDMSGMFESCSSLKSLDLSNFNTSNVTNMMSMFYGCKSLTSLNISNFNTNNVTNIVSMFSHCSSLTSLDVSNFDTSNVRYMGGMFYGCSSLTSLNLSNFNTSKVTNMEGMFNDCKKLELLDLSNFNTSNVTNINSMFCGCSSLTSLDLSSFDGSKLSATSATLDKCQNLEVIKTFKILPPRSKIKFTNTMYTSDGTAHTTMDVANATLTKTKPIHGVYYGINWILDAEGNLTLKGGTCTGTRGTKWNDTDVKTVKCDGEIICNDYFCTTLFKYNTNLVSADLSGFNTSNVTSTITMFGSCSSLTSLNLSSFNTSNVTTMNGMFYNCSSLTSLDLSNFDTSNVTTMMSMFDGCSSLTSLNLSNFNTSNVTNMSSMFYVCKKLELLDLSNFNTSNVTTMNGMFSGCSSLTSLDLSSFDGSKLSEANSMLLKCPNLEVIKTYKVLPQGINIEFTNTMYTSDGKAHTIMDVANATLTKTKPIHIHSYNDEIIVKPATPYNTGIIQKTCSCGDTYTEEIPQLKFNIFVDKTTRIKGIAKGNVLLFSNSSENTPFIIK